MNWHQAKVACRNQGGALASPESNEESDEIFRILGDKNAWLGLNDIRNEGQWTTLSYKLLPFKAWLPGEPNNWAGNQDCAQAVGSRKGWDDFNCNHVLNYVCVAVAFF